MRIAVLLLLILTGLVSSAQSVYPIRADTVKIYKVGGSAELVLQNSTKDSIGVLVNLGGGRTGFLRSKKLNDSTIVVGRDTLVIRSGSGLSPNSLTPTFLPYWDASDNLKNSPLSTTGGVVALRAGNVLYIGGVGPNGPAYISLADTAGLQVYNIGEVTAITGTGTPDDFLFFQGIATAKTRFNSGGAIDNLVISAGAIRPFVGTAATRPASPTVGDTYFDSDSGSVVSWTADLEWRKPAAGRGDRFGFPGEDTIAAEDRTFNAAGHQVGVYNASVVNLWVAGPNGSSTLTTQDTAYTMQAQDNLGTTGELLITPNRFVFKNPVVVASPNGSVLQLIDHVNGIWEPRPGGGGSGLTPIANHSYLGVSNLSGATATPAAVSQPFFMATDYPGIVGDSATDCAAGLQALIAFVQANYQGGTIYIPPGKYLLNSKVTIGGQIKLLGSGGPIRTQVSGTHSAVWSAARTTFFFTSATDTAFLVTGSGVHMDNFCVAQSIGITPSSSVGVAYQNGINSRLDNMGFMGFNVNVDMESGFQWSWFRCFFYAPKKYNALIRDTAISDAGDQALTDCWFYTDRYPAQAHIRWESGGGLRVIGNKFNQGSDGNRPKYGLDAQINKTTVDAIVANNSFENYDSSAIYFHPTVLFSDVVIGNNQISAYRSDSKDGPAIRLDGSASPGFNGVMIEGIEFRGNAVDTAIYINTTNNVTVGAVNYNVGYSTPNKRIVSVNSAPVFVTAQRPSYANPLTGTAPVMDLALGNFATYILTGVDTISFAGLPQEPFRVLVSQDATGGRTLLLKNCINAAQLTGLLGLNTAAGSNTFFEGYMSTTGNAVITRVNTTMTNNSVAYWDPVKGLSDDNTNFKYYATNQSLIIGPEVATSSLGQIEVSSNTGNFTPSIMIKKDVTSAIGPILLIAKTRGTAGSPTASALNDYNGQIDFAGHDGSGLRYSSSIASYADSAISSNSVPSSIAIHSGYTTDVDTRGANSIGINLDHNYRIGLGKMQNIDTALLTLGMNGAAFGTFNNGNRGNVFSGRPFTVTNWSSAATTTDYNAWSIPSYILGSSNTQTYTNASTVDILGAPSAGTNVTITSPWSFRVISGSTLLGGNVRLSGISTVFPLDTTSKKILTVDATGNVTQTNWQVPSSVAALYTPIFTNTTNISASTVRNSSYQKSGTIITGRISGDFTPTLLSATVLTATLPPFLADAGQGWVGSGTWIDATTGTQIPLLCTIVSTTTCTIQGIPVTANSGHFAVIFQYNQ